MNERAISHFKARLEPKKDANKQWYLSLLDAGEQFSYEEKRLNCTLAMLKNAYVSIYQNKIEGAKAEIAALSAKEGYGAGDYSHIKALQASIAVWREKIEACKCFFAEPYFARMDVVDEKEGYNSYYIGKKGDVRLEIVDWRAPLAVRYYQKSRVRFSINEYDYSVVLRRALSAKNGKLLDYKNEYLSVKEHLTAEEIAGRDEEILFDPFLRNIIKSRKDDVKIRDIIQTIQEKQFQVITLPERESFVLQGCAGSGKTMILLHRLSYLMYNNENLRPRDVLVITPSDSFNAFIDELSQVLELQKVRTVTLQKYYYQVLANEGIELEKKMGTERETKEYLAYLYSPKFTADARKHLSRIFEGIYGLFASEECVEVAQALRADIQRMGKGYEKIKNCSVRVRRTVLGEMKEDKEGKFYFTKPFRQLMSCLAQAEDFFAFLSGDGVKTPDYFLRQFIEFYRALAYASRHLERVFADAQEDLYHLADTVEREIFDLRRYRQKRGSEEILTYADRIARRQELKAEITKTAELIADMGGGRALLEDFFSVLKASSHCKQAGACQSAVDLARWLYRETVQKYKRKYAMKGIYPSDGYAICRVLSEVGRRLTPRFGLVFIDEGQDISAEEYELLKKIHGDAAFNVFGDLKQNITPYRGVNDWSRAVDGAVYELNQNYRNTNEIVEYVSGVLDVDMLPIGFSGEAVREISLKEMNAFFEGKQGLKAIIATESELSRFEKRGYHRLSSNGKIHKSKVNVMSVYESKGLEFSAVAVFDSGMTENEKYIACTRALRELALVK